MTVCGYNALTSLFVRVLLSMCVYGVCVCTYVHAFPPAIASQTLIVSLLGASTLCFVLFTLSFPGPAIQRVSSGRGVTVVMLANRCQTIAK